MTAAHGNNVLDQASVEKRKMNFIIANSLSRWLKSEVLGLSAEASSVTESFQNGNSSFEIQNLTDLHHASFVGKFDLINISLNYDNSLVNQPFECTSKTFDLETIDALQLSLIKSLDYPSLDIEQTISTLLYHGADPNCASSFFGMTPLHWAAIGSSPAIVAELIEQGARVNRSNVFGLQPIHYSVAAGNIAVTEILIDNGAIVNATDNYKRTPVHFACHCGNLDLLKLLVEMGANLCVYDAEMCSPLSYIYYNKEMLEYLLARLPAHFKEKPEEKSGLTPLLRACMNGWPDGVECLIQHGSNVNVKDFNGYTCLHYSCMGAGNAIPLLLENGADVNVLDSSGRSPLLQSLICGCSVRYVEMLLEADADLNTRDSHGRGLLHIACQKLAKLEVIEALLRYGCDPNQTDDYFRTPLHYAVSVGYEEAMKVLIEAGGDPKRSDALGDTALHAASVVKFNNAAFIEYLLTYVDADATTLDGSTALMLACKHGNLKVVQVLLNNGAQYSCEDAHHRTALHIAAESGNYEITKCLLEHLKYHYEINKCDNDRWSPIFYAMRKGHVHIIELLIRHGASINITDGDCRTPLYYLFNEDFTAPVEIIQLLVENGYFSIDGCVAGERITMLMLACKYGNEKVFDYLISVGASTAALDNNHNSCFDYLLLCSNLSFFSRSFSFAKFTKSQLEKLVKESSSAILTNVFNRIPTHLPLLDWLYSRSMNVMSYNSIDSLIIRASTYSPFRDSINDFSFKKDCPYFYVSLLKQPIRKFLCPTIDPGEFLIQFFTAIVNKRLVGTDVLFTKAFPTIGLCNYFMLALLTVYLCQPVSYVHYILSHIEYEDLPRLHLIEEEAVFYIEQVKKMQKTPLSLKEACRKVIRTNAETLNFKDLFYRSLHEYLYYPELNYSNEDLLDIISGAELDEAEITSSYERNN